MQLILDKTIYFPPLLQSQLFTLVISVASFRSRPQHHRVKSKCKGRKWWTIQRRQLSKRLPNLVNPLILLHLCLLVCLCRHDHPCSEPLNHKKTFKEILIYTYIGEQTWDETCYQDNNREECGKLHYLYQQFISWHPDCRRLTYKLELPALALEYKAYVYQIH